jgi:hypothetical protein
MLGVFGGLQMTPGWKPGLEIASAISTSAPSDGYGVSRFLPGLLANNEMAQQSNPAFSKLVEQKSPYKTAYLMRMRKRAQRVPSWPGEPSPTKVEYICADQPTTLTFR